MGQLERARKRLDTLREERNTIRDKQQAIVEQADAHNDGEGRDLTDDELAEVRDAADRVRALEAQIDEAADAVADLTAMQESRQAAADATPAETRDADVKVVRNEPVYRPDRPEVGFLADHFLAQMRNDRDAAERLAQHRGSVEQRATSTTANFTDGALPPQYLSDQYAAALQNPRVYADLVAAGDLPQTGMSLVLPRVTTSTTVAAQASEGGTLSTQALDTTDLVVPVRTIGGYVDVSRQTLERGGALADQLIMENMLGALGEEIERQAINGSGSSGEVEGTLNATGTIAITYTDASPTAVEILNQIALAIGSVLDQRKRPARRIVMSATRWYELVGAVDGSGRSVVVVNGNGPQNAAGTATAQAELGPVGTIYGVPVYATPAMPTNLGAGTDEDRIIVETAGDVKLWEAQGAPFGLKFESVGSSDLLVRCVAYTYAAMTAEWQPKGTAIIAGTGLIVA